MVDFSSKLPVEDVSNRTLGPVSSFLLTSPMAVGGHVIKVACSTLEDSRQVNFVAEHNYIGPSLAGSSGRSSDIDPPLPTHHRK